MGNAIIQKELDITVKEKPAALECTDKFTVANDNSEVVLAYTEN